jgi:hypothetical protein
VEIREGVKLIAVPFIMRVVLQRTAYLFWQYPVLWLPVLVADLLKFWVILAGHRLAHMASFATLHHSAISGALEPPSGTRMIWFSTAGGLFIWGSNFIGVALYCFALGILTRAISGFQPGKDFAATETPVPDPASTVSPIMEHMNAANSEIGKLKLALPKRWVRCSILVLLASVVALLAGILATQYLLQPPVHRWNPWFSGRVTVFCEIFIGALLSLAPILSFISSNLTPQSDSLHNRVLLNRPRLMAYATTAAFCFVYIALWLFASMVIDSVFQDIPILRTTFPRNITEMMGSLVVALPFIPAMIALILIVKHGGDSSTKREVKPYPESPISIHPQT